MTTKNVSPSFGGLFDVETKRESIQEIESIMSVPGFWDDTAKSQHIIKERTTLEKIVQMWDGLSKQAEDVRVMIELGEEAQDEETLAEVAQMNTRLQQGVE